MNANVLSTLMVLFDRRIKGDDLSWLYRHPLGANLFFTALAEINANCQMFGGRESDSYKIKRKRLIQTAKRFITSLKENTHV